MILFLDFDGVLHPTLGDADGRCRPVLWSVLEACPQVEVVLSTTWRLEHPMESLLQFITEGGGEHLAGRIVGATPQLLLDPDGDSYYRRIDECRAWLAGSGMGYRPWVAVDDAPDHFDPGCRQLYLTNWKTGLVDGDVPRLIQMLCG